MKDLKKKINKDYLDSEISKINDGDLEFVMNNSEKITKKISGAGALKKYTELAKMMVGMISDFRKGEYKEVPWFSIAAIGFVLLYVLNPWDILPDFIPGVGYVDDFAVFTVILRFLQTDLHKYLDWKIASQNKNA